MPRRIGRMRSVMLDKNPANSDGRIRYRNDDEHKLTDIFRAMRGDDQTDRIL